MQISNSNQLLSANFKMLEFYSGSQDAPESHFLDHRIPNVAQWLRDYYDKPISIESTYRTTRHNALVGGAVNSQHLYGNAFDFKIHSSSAMSDIKEELENRGLLFDSLIAFGVRGFGIYDTFIHLDFRSTGGNHSHTGIDYAFWDLRKKKA